MSTVQDHSHNFSPGAWPFPDPVNTAAYTSTQVIDGHPILLVFHDHDGEWQFLHGPVSEADEGRLVCLGCAYDEDNAIGILGDLPSGWMAGWLIEHLRQALGSASPMRTATKMWPNNSLKPNPPRESA